MTTCVVAEDESLLREELASLLRRTWPDVEIVALCEDGGSALEAISEHRPDVAFLDIRMPGLTGLEVAADRLAATVKRLEGRAPSAQPDSARLAEIIERLRASLPAASSAPSLTWITASVGKETRLIAVEDVAYFRADSKYTVVMTAQGEALIRKTIRELLDVLDPATFKQIHRSTIVNLKAVAAVTRDEAGRGGSRTGRKRSP
jgi:DNA-binding LytR/AlgR family response regulator